MNSKVICPTCKHSYGIPEGERGGRQICPRCQAPFFAAAAGPGATTAAPPPVPQAGYARTMMADAPPAIRYSCPRCQASLEAAASAAGTKTNCPHCSQRHQVPALSKTETIPPSLNRTMLTSEEGVGAGNVGQGAWAAGSMGGASPVTPGSPPGAGPWATLLTQKKVLLGSAGLLALLLVIILVVFRGGKAGDTESPSKAQLEMAKQKQELEQKKMEMERQARTQANARQQIEELRRNQAEADRRRDEDRQRQRAIEDEEREAARKKQLREEQQQREKEKQKQDLEYQKKLEEARRKLEETRNALEKEKGQKEKKEVTTQAPVPIGGPGPIPPPRRPIRVGGRILPDPGTLSAFGNNTGAVYRFRVTGSVVGAVWGTGVYTTDSSLATAAVHAGVLRPGQRGIVRVEILPGRPAYTGSLRRGVATASWPAFPSSFRFR